LRYRGGKVVDRAIERDKEDRERMKRIKEGEQKQIFKGIVERITLGRADEELMKYLEENYVLFKVTDYRIARKRKG